MRCVAVLQCGAAPYPVRMLRVCVCPVGLGVGLEPTFDVPIVNVTVVRGQIALLPCSIDFLGKYKVYTTAGGVAMPPASPEFAGIYHQPSYDCVTSFRYTSRTFKHKAMVYRILRPGPCTKDSSIRDNRGCRL